MSDQTSTLRNWAVMADDLSGAAELAGAALRYGLTAEVTTVAKGPLTTDVRCVDANTRTLPASQAAEITAKLTVDLLSTRPKLVFKKTDSLLRGNSREEIEAMLRTTGQPRSLLCPANPTRGRVVRAGRYRVEGIPLEETPFAHDPTHPRRSSMIRDLLGEPASSIQTPDVLSTQDLRAYAEHVDDSTLPAGGVEFFEALLYARGLRPAELPQIPLSGNKLFVCGSPAAWGSGRVDQAAHHGMATVRLDERAAASCSAWIVSNGQVQLAIGDRLGEPSELGASLASIVAEVLAYSHVDILLLEGGATAKAVLQHLGCTRLKAIAEVSSGTVLLEDPTGRLPRLIIKPGSYPWPEIIWQNSPNV